MSRKTKKVTATKEMLDLVMVCDSLGDEHEFEGKGMNFYQDASGQVRVYLESESTATACFTAPIWVKRELADDR